MNRFEKAKLKSKKKLLIAMTSGLIFLNGCVQKDNYSVKQNVIGYEDLNCFFQFVPKFMNKDVQEENFVIFNVGDNNDAGVYNLESKIEYCNKNDISVGLVVNTDCEKENEMYDNVEIVRNLIFEYDIDMPVYLNIDKIIINDNLNVEQKTKLINDFLLKCSNNGIYCGVYGTDSNLVLMKKYCNIKNCDAFVVMDKSTIEYDGVYNIVKDLSGNIMASINLAELINDKSLNRSDNFVSDVLYQCKSNDNIDEIAMKYGMSVNELLNYNDLEVDDLKNGAFLNIPSYSDANVENIAVLDKAIVGLDISEHQYLNGVQCDWDSLSNNVSYLLLRSNYGLVKDLGFDEFTYRCTEYNIPFGIYSFTGVRGYNYNNLEDFEEACERENLFVMECCKNKSVVYPCFLDIEVDGSRSNEVGKDVKDIWNVDQINIMLNTWYNNVKDCGGIPGIYCNASTYDYLKSVYYDLDTKFELWIAGGKAYDRELTMEEATRSSYGNFIQNDTSYYSTFDIVQVSQYGKGFGFDCDVDVNYSVKNFRKVNAQVKLKDIDRIDYRDYYPYSIGACIVLGCFVKKLVKKRK